ncbi:hypothetical protein AB3S75_031328 [Citrus x aurantiifolia]
MAITTTCSLSVTPINCRSATPINPLQSSFLSYSLTRPFNSNSTLKVPGFRVSASSMSSIHAPESLSRTSFLDRRESGFLHFIKYHGLGNDFILVLPLSFFFSIYVWFPRKFSNSLEIS